MTNQTRSNKSLGGWPAVNLFRLSTLTLAAIVAVCGYTAAAQTQTDTAKSATSQPVTVKPAKPAKKAPSIPGEPAGKAFGKYNVHQTVELGGRMTQRSGSTSMWATMINQGTGARLLDHSIQMHTNDPSKTPFFDTLTSSSFGYGGDPNNVSTLNVSKGRIYDFAGMFRRDRNYFDYNLMVNSLLGPLALTPEVDSLHVFNTVRRNTDTQLTLFPLSTVHFRAGFNHGTHEGPTFTTIHGGGDVQVLQWFRNASDTYVGGVDVNVARRTTVSYDQFYILYKGDSPYSLAGPLFAAKNGLPATPGFNMLNTSTCGSGGAKTAVVVGGVINAYCSQTLVQSQTGATRTQFPTEQLRFSSRYWDRVVMNGHLAYNGGVTNLNNFNETFTGLLARTFLRQEIDTGALSHGSIAHNKRVAVTGDYGFEAELNPHFTLSDAVNYFDFRNQGTRAMTAQIWAGTDATHPAGLNVMTPLSALTATTTTSTDTAALSMKNAGNTVLGIVTVNPQWKFSAGWRFNDREIKNDDDPTLIWHQNWMLLGTVFQPQKNVRATVNYEMMRAASANSLTTANTYTREAPDRINHVRGRLQSKPNNWINFAVTGNAYWAKNTDPLVNMQQHNYNVSFSSQVEARDNLSFDLALSRDAVYSRTDMCYLYSLTAAPYGDPGSQGTCLQTAANPTGTLNTAAVTSQLRLGNGYYSAPSTFFSGSFNYSPVRKVKLAGGVRVTDVNGEAELLNPYTVPGALMSTILEPYADAQFAIAPEWTWHGNWTRHGYYETDGGPSARSFEGDVVTLGVKYAF